ncbi:uncharacterized protein LOC121384258 [Gigantopelta aegis]|uniref:uncharacterized protein LOC121384258 n=1 Tax=Gigantopelta aegis TaxID=1735272 RepID=UPI001B888009|nr:uncharacterized protein LOC121384258 [Gigantopelta aegis]
MNIENSKMTAVTRLMLAVVLFSRCIFSSKEQKVIFLPFSGNTPVYLKPQWISVTQLDNERNVTVQYSAMQNAQVTWYLNGYIVSVSDERFSPVHTKKRLRSLKRGRRTVRQASVKIPNDYEISDLRVILTLKVFEVELQINMPSPNETRTEPEVHAIQEILPSWGLHLEPHESVGYTRGADVTVRSVLISEYLNDAIFLGTNFSFTSIDKCTTPIVASMKTPESDPEFMRSWVPEENDPALDWETGRYLGKPTYKYRFLQLLRPRDRFRGILTVSTAFRPADTCHLLFGSIRITRFAFFKPYLSQKFFGKDLVAFLDGEESYTAKVGSDVDVKTTALGGFYEGWDVRDNDSNPRIKLYKNGYPVSDVERVDTKRLFQREVAHLFRNVTVEMAGRYLWVAEMGGSKVKRGFTLYVKAECG